MTYRTAATGLVLVLAGLTAAQAQAQPRTSERTTFTVGNATAARGEKATGTIEVPAGSDAALSIPVAIFHGAKPGPVLALVAGSHGTEYTSIIALEKLIATLRPAEISGTVIIVPLINIPSFEQKVPHLNPVDRKSMNRWYPGKMDGTQTDRASFLITKQVVEQCDHLIDLHGGDLDESLRPYSYWTKTGNEKAGSDVQGNVVGIRSRSHHHLGRSAEGPTSFPLSGKHRHHPRQSIDHGRGGLRRHSRNRRPRGFWWTAA